MKKQLVVIHGGEAFQTYDEYVTYLKTTPIDLEHTKGWKSGLAEALGEGFEVIAPRMPNASNAKFAEWSIWFERHIPFMHDGVVLLGHSLGGIFLAKYLAENLLPKKIAATFLVAAPYDFLDFTPPVSLEKLAVQGGAIHLYHSSDDPFVDFGELAKYQKALPEAHATTFADRGHFIGAEFPEIVRNIQDVGAASL